MKNLNIALVDYKAEYYNRITDLNKLRDVIKAAKKLEMFVTVYFIIGMPGQTIDDILETIYMIVNLNTALGPSIFYPLPYLEICNNTDISKISYTQMRSTAVSVEPSGFTKEDVITIFRFCRMINIINANPALREFDFADIIDEQNNTKLISRYKLSNEILTAFIFKKILNSSILYGIKSKFDSLKNGSYHYYYYEHKQNKDLTKKMIAKFKKIL